MPSWASASWRFKNGLTVTFDATNLGDAVFQDYFGPNASLYPRDTRLYDRTFEIGLRYRH